jgi:hypothetical protein
MTAVPSQSEAAAEQVVGDNSADPESGFSVNLDAAAEDMRQRINHLLEVYPYISRAMIQVGLSPAIPPKMWGPVLDQMAERGEVVRHEVDVTNASNRTITKNIYHLPSSPYPPLGITQPSSSTES